VLAVVLTALGVSVILAGYVSHLSSRAATPARQAPSPAHAVAVPRGLPAAEAGLMPWHLAAPVSREVAVAGPPGRLIVLGGLTTGGGSASGIYAVRTGSGAVHQVGALSAPVHDAAVAVIGQHAVVFGGGSPATVATVQAFTLHGRHSRSQDTTATAAGSMPAPRSDAAAATVGSTTCLGHLRCHDFDVSPEFC
jgi:hypothetical protein